MDSSNLNALHEDNNLAQKKIRVLLIDDDPDVGMLVKVALRHTNYYVIDQAYNLATGLTAIRSKEHDIYLVDYRLGNDNGLDLIRAAVAENCQRPMIMLTGYADPKNDLQALEAGAADYLDKGAMYPDGLERAIRYALKAAQARDALQVSQERLKAVLDNAVDSLVVVDKDDKILYANAIATRELFNRFSTMQCAQLCAVNVGEHEVMGLESTSGEKYYVDVRTGSIPWDAGAAQLVTIRDITDLKTMEHKTQDSEDRLSLAMEAAQIGVWKWDLQRDIVSFDDKTTQLLGLNPDTFGGSFSDFVQIVHPEDRQRLDPLRLIKLSDGKAFEDEFRVVWPDGTTHVIYSRGKVTRSNPATPPHIIGVAWDISATKQAERERANLEKQLLHSEKMAAIGQLAAGVAHEINTPLGYVSSNVCTLARHMEDLLQLMREYRELETMVSNQPNIMQRIDGLRKNKDLTFIEEDSSLLLSDTIEGLERIQLIVKDLREFSHGDDSRRAPTDLHKCIDTALHIAQNELKSHADVVKNYNAIPLVQCIDSHIVQVCVNLFVNAAQAMERRGTITIKTEADGNYVDLFITDTGKGIKPEHLSRVFEPFFTTKPIGKGTGLGLSLSYKIIKSHNGSISVVSTPGEGTTFHVRLPVTQPCIDILV